ncbi:MAG: sporulation protein YunB [Cellulosilyticaceae bacterium]
MFKGGFLFRRYKYRYRPTPKPKMQYTRRLHYHKVQGVFAMLIIIAIFSLIYIQLDREVMPTVMAMAKLQGTTAATKAINEAVSQSLKEIQATEQDMLSYDYNDQGELVSWNVNAILINTLCADMVDKANTALENLGEVAFKIPLGNLTGSHIFANLGPDIEVKVLPVGTVKIDYDNNIRATGINQVNHTVWLDIQATIQVVVPLFSDQIVVNRRVVLIDKMISGKVPPSYVNVLPDNVLDVAPGDVEEELGDLGGAMVNP